MTIIKKQIGAQGETLAQAHLRSKGYAILATNYLIRGGELDIVAQINGTIVFCEVKTRLNHTFGLPEEAITHKKLQVLERTAQWYLQQYKLHNKPCRFDAIVVELTSSGEVNRIEHLENISQ